MRIGASQKQVTFASALGAVVPLDATRREASRVIDGRMAQLETEAIRVSGLVVGSIVEFEGKLHALLTLQRDECWLASIEDGKLKKQYTLSRREGELKANFVPRYNPPVGFTHRVITHPPRLEGENSAEFRLRKIAFWAFAETRIAPAGRFVHPEYGQFWSKSEVQRCIELFLNQE